MSIALVACGSGPTVPLAPGAPWPKFRGDAAQNGAQRRSSRPATAGRSGASRPAKGVFSSPVVGADGTIYVGSADRNFYALDARRHAARGRSRPARSSTPPALLDDQRPRLLRLGRRHPARASTRRPGEPVVDLRGRRSRGEQGVHQLVRGQRGDRAGRARSTCPTTTSSSTPSTATAATSTGASACRDQTWSLPAVDATTGHALHRQQQPARRARARTRSRSTPDGDHALGGALARHGRREPAAHAGRHDGRRAASTASCAPTTTTDGERALVASATRDHIYASPRASCPTARSSSRRPTARSTRSTPATGAALGLRHARADPLVARHRRRRQRLRRLRATGRLFVLNPDGTLRWSMRLIDAERNDLNASPALGARRDLPRRRERRRSSACRTTTACAPTNADDARCSPTPPTRRRRALVVLRTPSATLATPRRRDRRQPAAHARSLVVRAERGAAARDPRRDVIQVSRRCRPTRRRRRRLRRRQVHARHADDVAFAGGPLHVTVYGGYLVDLRSARACA